MCSVNVPSYLYLNLPSCFPVLILVCAVPDVSLLSCVIGLDCDNDLKVCRSCQVTKKRNQKRPEGLWRFLCWILMPRVFWYIKNLKCELLGLGIYLCTVLFAVELTEVVKFTWNCSIFSLFFLCVIPFCILDLFTLLNRYKFKRIESWKDKCIDVSLNKVFPFLIRSIWQNHIGDCSRQSRHWKLCIWMDRALDLKSLEAFDSIRTYVFNTGKYFCLNWTN